MKARNWAWMLMVALVLPPAMALAAGPEGDRGTAPGTGRARAFPVYGQSDLGPTFTGRGITLKFWSPASAKVVLVLFDPADQTAEIGRREMAKGPDGTWEVTLTADEITANPKLGQAFYQFESTLPGRTVRVLDPYARSMAEFAGGPADPVGKAALVDPAAAGTVTGYAKIPGYRKRTDAIIYEVHVRDFTSDPDLPTKARFGTYRAFAERLDHLKTLGVTHVQLLPVQSWNYGDEAKGGVRELHWSVKDNTYNWGYDPHGYFSPEGMYSENPRDPARRVAELKALIEAIHRAGMGVILDVVYNHTARTDTFDDILPGYFYRRGPDGKPTSNSGCGNDFATTQPMARKLIIDSVSYWTHEYKVDGFRFDLMGLIDTETVTMAYVEAARANPDVLFLGEGWRMYNGPAGTKGADQDWMAETDDVAVFSDSFRDLLKFGGFNEGVPAFLTGRPTSLQDIFRNLKGQPTNFAARSPANVVQYLEAHDGLTWHDTICCALKLDPRKDRPEIFQRLKLGNLMLLTSQGIAFLHAGQEMGRTKEWRGPGLPPGENKEGTPFIRNSYDSSDAINAFDWDLLQTPEGGELAAYTRGLIALRKSSDAFRLADPAVIDKNVALVPAGGPAEDLAIGWRCRGTDGKEFGVFVNADRKPRSFPLPGELTDAQVVVDAVTAGTTPIITPTGIELTSTTITLAPLTGVVLAR
ncbi:MAG: pullulanase [Candidatus Riflebacteria bacterium]|nr:pullulanase [Candidatus Riflebacteria bacterium]